jgi:uncharacterized membrane protein YtjA (UPF0391 family)
LIGKRSCPGFPARCDALWFIASKCRRGAVSFHDGLTQLKHSWSNTAPSPADDRTLQMMAARHTGPTSTETRMLHYAVVFFVIAIIAAVLGFSGIAGAASNIAWILFVVFLILAVVSLLRGKRV